MNPHRLLLPELQRPLGRQVPRELAGASDLRIVVVPTGQHPGEQNAMAAQSDHPAVVTLHGNDDRHEAVGMLRASPRLDAENQRRLLRSPEGRPEQNAQRRRAERQTYDSNPVGCGHRFSSPASVGESRTQRAPTLQRAVGPAGVCPPPASRATPFHGDPR